MMPLYVSSISNDYLKLVIFKILKETVWMITSITNSVISTMGFLTLVRRYRHLYIEWGPWRKLDWLNINCYYSLFVQYKCISNNILIFINVYDKVKCRYNMVQYNMILHSALQCLKQYINQRLYSQNTSHTRLHRRGMRCLLCWFRRKLTIL